MTTSLAFFFSLRHIGSWPSRVRVDALGQAPLHWLEWVVNSEPMAGIDPIVWEVAWEIINE